MVFFQGGICLGCCIGDDGGARSAQQAVEAQHRRRVPVEAEQQVELKVADGGGVEVAGLAHEAAVGDLRAHAGDLGDQPHRCKRRMGCGRCWW